MLHVQGSVSLFTDVEKRFFVLLCLVLAAVELHVIQIIMQYSKVRMGPDATECLFNRRAVPFIKKSRCNYLVSRFVV